MKSWPSDPVYQASKAIVFAMNVINDCAECGVKFNSDFLSCAGSEGHCQNVLQVVKRDRKQQLNLCKQGLN